MTIASGLRSQDDKVWIPRADALRKLAQADSLVTYKQLLQAKQRDVDTLNERINAKESIIKSYRSMESAFRDVIALKQQEIDNDKKLRDAFEGEIKDLSKQLKKQRRKTRLVAFAGIITTAAGVFFIK